MIFGDNLGDSPNTFFTEHLWRSASVSYNKTRHYPIKTDHELLFSGIFLDEMTKLTTNTDFVQIRYKSATQSKQIPKS